MLYVRVSKKADLRKTQIMDFISVTLIKRFKKVGSLHITTFPNSEFVRVWLVIEVVLSQRLLLRAYSNSSNEASAHDALRRILV